MRSGAKNPDKAGKLALIAELRKQLAELTAEVDKAAPSIAEVAPVGQLPGVAGLSGPSRGTRRRLRKTAAEPAVDAMIAAAFVPDAAAVTKHDQNAHVVPTNASGVRYQDPMDAEQFIDAQRLLVGMDYEMSLGADVEAANETASRSLAANMRAYDPARPGPDDIHTMDGLDLDLGSGNARARGFLGLDVYPFDHGTIIADLNMGIPFAASSARQVRMNNSLDAIVDDGGSAMPLLTEVQRVLAVGGLFHYAGPSLRGRANLEALPGMHVDDRKEVPGVDGSPGLETLTMSRRAARLPAVHGANPLWLGYTEQGPRDLALAQSAYTAPDGPAVAMANLVQKGRVPWRRTCEVIKADKHQQIVYGVVLTPDEQDSQDDIMSAEDIEVAAHQFLIDARVVGKEHTEPLAGGQVVESYIAPTDMAFTGGQFGPQTVTKGSWVMGIKVNDDAEWAALLDGDYTGFSVGGYGQREPI